MSLLLVHLFVSDLCRSCTQHLQDDISVSPEGWGQYLRGWTAGSPETPQARGQVFFGVFSFLLLVIISWASWHPVLCLCPGWVLSKGLAEIPLLGEARLGTTVVSGEMKTGGSLIQVQSTIKMIPCVMQQLCFREGNC